MKNKNKNPIYDDLNKKREEKRMNFLFEKNFLYKCINDSVYPSTNELYELKIFNGLEVSAK